LLLTPVSYLFLGRLDEGKKAKAKRQVAGIAE
jgi:hypothetical protein